MVDVSYLSMLEEQLLYLFPIHPKQLSNVKIAFSGQNNDLAGPPPLHSLSHG